MHPKAKLYIDKLQLVSHPEGGYFKEVYRSEEKLLKFQLPERYNSSRVFSTSIYFLLEGKQVSKFHRLKSDELWHFYDGSTLSLYMIDNSGSLTNTLIGRNIENGNTFQTNIKKGTWFGAELLDKSLFALIGCSVTPGFEFFDFEMGNKQKLLEEFPQHKEIIQRLC